MRVRSTDVYITDFSASLYSYPLKDTTNLTQISLSKKPVAGSTTVTFGNNTNMPDGIGLAIALQVYNTDWGIAFVQLLGVVSDDQDLTFVLVHKDQGKPIKKQPAKKKR
jgi:hypothetical protein